MRALSARLENRLWGQLGQRLISQLTDQLSMQLRRQLLEELQGHERLGLQLDNHFAGGWTCGWPALFDYCSRIGVSYTQEDMALLQLWTQVSRECHWWFPYEGIVLASDRPRVLTVDAAGRLHNERGAALEYSDGLGVHAWHGVRVEGWVIAYPASLTVYDIEGQTNAEVRRVLIERYGWQRYIEDCGSVVDHVPDDHPVVGLRGARLLRKELPGEPEPIVYLDMVNSTAEADGTHRHYLERVDPKAYGGDAGRLCHAAMASRWHHRDASGALVRTFARWQDYLPVAES
jgi:hypothetical protein